MGAFPGIKLYHYEPSFAAAILFIILFVLTTALHMYQAIQTRTRYLAPLIVGGFFEFVGYIGRAIASHQNSNFTLGPAIMQSLLILLAPLLFAATIYMGLGRIVKAIDGDKQCLIRPVYLTKIFVAGDIFSFFVQGCGGGVLSYGKNLTLGSNIIVAGLFIQLISFGFFIMVSISFNRTIERHPTNLSLHPAIPWFKHLAALYAASCLIMVRSVFRVVEYVQGQNGYLLAHECFLYIFDATSMLGVMITFNVIHPSEVRAMLNGGRVVRNGFQVFELKR